MNHFTFVFNTFLARSPDGLNNWEQIVILQDNASQGKVWINPDGHDILLLFETAANDGNYISIKHYKNLASMKRADSFDRMHF